MAKKKEWKKYYDPLPTYSTRRVQFTCPKCEYEIDRLASDEVLAEHLFEIHLRDEHDITVEEI